LGTSEHGLPLHWSKRQPFHYAEVFYCYITWDSGTISWSQVSRTPYLLISQVYLRDLPSVFFPVSSTESLSELNMRHILFFAAFVTLALPAAAAAAPQCFYPDGVTVEPNHTPCNTTVTNSACCLPQDACTADGLCLGTANFNYRGSCTDKTWTSNACPQTCRLGKLQLRFTLVID
jgi:hypothetical protein